MGLSLNRDADEMEQSRLGREHVVAGSRPKFRFDPQPGGAATGSTRPRRRPPATTSPPATLNALLMRRGVLIAATMRLTFDDEQAFVI